MDENKPQLPFVFHGTYEFMDSLLADVAKLDEEEWRRYKYRQQNIVGHKQTQTVPLLFDQHKKYRPIKHRNYDLFSNHLTQLSQVVGASVKRANLVKLLPQSEITPHYDKGDFLSSTKRLHLPVVTNEGCVFSVGGETKHLPIGEIWEINNTGMLHGVVNAGDSARIHLIFDVR